MINYIIRRVLIMIPTLLAVSVLVFVVIQLPPGDIITSRLQELQAEGQDISEEQIAALRARYHLDDPMFIQYFKWMGGFLRGDMGYSVMYGQSVNNLIWERLGYTLLDYLDRDLVDLAGRLSGGHLFGSAPVLGARLRGNPRGLRRLSDAQFPARAGFDVLGLRVVWDCRGRVVFSRVRECAVELGQVRRFARASVDPGRGHRHGWHGRADADHARQSPRRAGQALRNHGAGQGPWPGPLGD